MGRLMANPVTDIIVAVHGLLCAFKRHRMNPPAEITIDLDAALHIQAWMQRDSRLLGVAARHDADGISLDICGVRFIARDRFASPNGPTKGAAPVTVQHFDMPDQVRYRD